MIAATVKSVITRLPPPLQAPLRALYNRRRSARRLSKHIEARLRVSRTVRSICGQQVVRGPFAGLRYGDALTTDLGAKCLGSYERELQPSIERLIAKGYSRVINIGCTEGYYAVGLAMRLPGATVFAYDIDDSAQRQCRDVANLNGVASRVRIAGECTQRSLSEEVGTHCLLVLDCEGCELELLRPDLVPELAEADIIVELHEFLGYGADDLVGRFETTHAVELVASTPRNPSEYEELAGLPAADRELTLFERPFTMRWAVLESGA